MAKAAILARPASSEMSVTLEHITPQIAARMLEANTNNRPARNGLIQSYADDMRAGRWQMNGDAIRFNVDGQLIDGQHRLLAVVRSGLAISSLVIRNLPAEAFQTIDGGATRKAGDLLNLMDVKNARFITLHCSATRPSQIAGVKEIRSWHKAKGWSDIGYHFVVRRDGRVEKGRPITQTGAHVQGWNTNNVGICLEGGIGADRHTDGDRA